MTAHALPGSSAHGPRTWLFTVTTAAAVTYTAEQETLPYPLTLRAVPGSGGTLLVEYRVSPTGDWVAWPAGTVSSATVYQLNGPVEALRFTAAVANGVVEVAQ